MTHSPQKQLLTVEEAQSKKMEMLVSVLLRGVKSLRQALSVGIEVSGNTRYSIATNPEVRKNSEQITKFITGSSGLKGDDIENIINATANLAVVQYLAKKYGCVVVEESAYQAMKTNFIAQLQALEKVA